MPPSSQPRVFLSYAKDGTDLVQRLHTDLLRNFDTWLDKKRLTAGGVWSAEIEHAIDRAEVVVALLSEGSFTSDIWRAEQIWALDEGKCVIPLLVQRECGESRSVRASEAKQKDDVHCLPSRHSG